MTRRYQQLLTLALFFILGTIASITWAHENPYVENLAVQIEQQATRVRAEAIRFNRGHTYYQLVGNLTQIEHLAGHIQRMARHRDNLRHLKHDLRRLDRLVHESEDLFRQLERAAHHGHHHFHRGVHPAYRLFHSMEVAIHQLQNIVERTNSNCQSQWTNQRQDYLPIQGQPLGFGGFSLNRNGMVIRNGRFGFNFSF
ncbi:MAG: hypothetical protein MK108_00805 [Mariniblastus sp.]|nr:hypothetical protein [Mariniblastus sp.]